MCALKVASFAFVVVLLLTYGGFVTLLLYAMFNINRTTERECNALRDANRQLAKIARGQL